MLTLHEPKLAMLRFYFIALLSATLFVCAFSAYGIVGYIESLPTDPPEGIPDFYWYVLVLLVTAIGFLTKAFFGVLAKYQKSMEDRIKYLEKEKTRSN